MTQLDNIKSFRIAPGDTIAICSPTVLRQQDREQIRAVAEERFPDNLCVVLDGGMSIGVVGQQEQLDRIEVKLDALLNRGGK